MMKKIYQLPLKVLRRIFSNLVSKPIAPIQPVIFDADLAGNIIYDCLMSDSPCMIARFGSNELSCLLNYRSVNALKPDILGYLRGDVAPWWWNKNIINQMESCAGFFPPDVSLLEKFCVLMEGDAELIDILGSWLPNELQFARNVKEENILNIELLTPFFSKVPWTKALEGKRVLVIHPFASTIERQYKVRDLLFPNELLPLFELQTIKAVQSIVGEKTQYANWFDALEHMKSEISTREFDICLIGCGAYGLPLAAHVKRIGKKAFHLGGSLQLLFGIRGKRWENENYNANFPYYKLINEFWVKPGQDERPKFADKVERACYW
jgi:hypothetical protein